MKTEKDGAQRDIDAIKALLEQGRRKTGLAYSTLTNRVWGDARLYKRLMSGTVSINTMREAKARLETFLQGL